MKKAIYKIRDRRLPKQIQKRIPKKFSGISFIPPGWRSFVCLLDSELAEVCPDYVIHQIKSKYGMLRYYIDTNMNPVPKEVRVIINKYETMSEHICEVCGQQANRISDTRWARRTRCNNHKE